MQQFKHYSSLPRIKSANAEMISKAILNIKSPTRGDVSKRAGVTEMTVCRAMAKLVDADFVLERKPKNQPHGSAVISVATDLKFIVIHLALDEFTAYLLNSNHKTVEKFSYSFNHSLDPSDNLSIFLERAKDQFSRKNNYFSSIGLVIDDGFSGVEVAKAAINESFGAPADVILGIPDCLMNLSASAIDSHFPTENLYYLNLGKRNLAYFITDSFYIKSSPRSLTCADGRKLEENLDSCISADQLYEVILSVVNSASAILDAKLFLIESDRFILGNNIGFSVAEKLKLKFGDRRKMFVSDTQPPFYIKGASIALQKTVIKSILEK